MENEKKKNMWEELHIKEWGTSENGEIENPSREMIYDKKKKPKYNLERERETKIV